jgi:hypothetical protein
MKLFRILLVFSVVLSFLASCKKSSEYVPEPYKCKCGSINWNGKSYDLLSSSYILSDSTQSSSRKYFVSAKISDKATERKNLNLEIVVPDITASPLQLNDLSSDFNGIGQEVEVFDAFDVTLRYRISSGTISVNPALFGGTESVNFSFTLEPQFSTSTPVFTVSGNFQVEINN